MKPKPQAPPRSSMREDIKLVLELAECASDKFDKREAIARVRHLLEVAPEMLEFFESIAASSASPTMRRAAILLVMKARRGEAQPRSER